MTTCTHPFPTRPVPDLPDPIAPSSDAPRLGTVLRSLGVFGCTAIEDALLAGLALDEPVLLIGGPGCAKTRLAERLAAGLRMRFWAYDAGKALFEDVIGFPDPASLADGEVRYVPTRLSLWGKQFILIDEISRANPAMQNKWLEIVRSRRLMGMDLPDLRAIVAAMNPPGLPGTIALDEALAGRFTFQFAVPDAHAMSNDDRRCVIEAPDDETTSSALPDLRPLLATIRDALPDAKHRDGTAATRYVEHLADYFAAKASPLDGRRLGMMRRALVALSAVHHALGEGPADPATLLALFRHGLDCTLPFAASGREVGRVVVDGAHAFASAAVLGQTRALPPNDVLAGAVLLTADPVRVADPDQVALLVTRIFQGLDHPRSIDAAARSGAALLTLVNSPKALAHMGQDARFRLMSGYRDLLDMDVETVTEFMSECESLAVDDPVSPIVREAALRIAKDLAVRVNHVVSTLVDLDDVAPKLIEYYLKGGAQ